MDPDPTPLSRRRNIPFR
ncbi:mgtA regulatory leader peptide MgtL [Citrobacter sp. R56]